MGCAPKPSFVESVSYRTAASRTAGSAGGPRTPMEPLPGPFPDPIPLPDPDGPVPDPAPPPAPHPVPEPPEPIPVEGLAQGSAARR